MQDKVVLFKYFLIKVVILRTLIKLELSAITIQTSKLKLNS